MGAWLCRSTTVGYGGGEFGRERGSQGDPLDKSVDRLAELWVLLHEDLDLVHRVQHGRMVLAAERAADLRQRGMGELTGEIHRDLAGERHRLRAVLRLEVGELDPVGLRHLALNLFDRDDLLFLAPEIAEHFLSEVDRHLASGERTKRDHARERAFELPNVRLYPAGDEVRDVIGEPHALESRLLLQNRNARLEVRRLNVCDQPPLESRAQTLLDLGNVLRRRVARHDDLFARLVERVEGVEELLLRPLLAGDELDVVDQEQIDVAIARAELRRAVVANCVDELVREALGRDVDDDHAGEQLRALVPDRM